MRWLEQILTEIGLDLDFENAKKTIDLDGVATGYARNW